MNKRLEDWVNWVLYDELKKGELNAPKHLLGIHDYGEGQVITCYRPYANKVTVATSTGKNESELEELADGFYGIYFPKKKFKDKKYKITTQYQDGTSVTTADCYAFDGQISDYDVYLFAEGKNYDIYEKLGEGAQRLVGFNIACDEDVAGSVAYDTGAMLTMKIESGLR